MDLKFVCPCKIKSAKWPRVETAQGQDGTFGKSARKRPKAGPVAERGGALSQGGSIYNIVTYLHPLGDISVKFDIVRRKWDSR